MKVQKLVVGKNNVSTFLTLTVTNYVDRYSKKRLFSFLTFFRELHT